MLLTLYILPLLPPGSSKLGGVNKAPMIGQRKWNSSSLSSSRRKGMPRRVKSGLPLAYSCLCWAWHSGALTVTSPLLVKLRLRDSRWASGSSKYLKEKKISICKSTIKFSLTTTQILRIKALICRWDSGLQLKGMYRPKKKSSLRLIRIFFTASTQSSKILDSTYDVTLSAY